MTNDQIADDFFGCAGVARIPTCRTNSASSGYEGYRHHVSMTPCAWSALSARRLAGI